MKPFTIVVLIALASLLACSRRTGSNASSNSTQSNSEARTLKTPRVNRSSITVGGYTIATALDVPMSQNMQDQVAVLNFGGHKLAVNFDNQQLILDDSEPVALPSGSKDIKVEFLGGKLIVKAGEATVLSPSLSTE